MMKLKAIFFYYFVISENHTLEHLSPTQQSCQLGSEVLLNTSKGHEMVKAEILEQIPEQSGHQGNHSSEPLYW